jgi:hypothetical protein
MSAVDSAFHRFADDAVKTLPPGGGLVPGVPFYPDEIGKWAEAQSG